MVYLLLFLLRHLSFNFSFQYEEPFLLLWRVLARQTLSSLFLEQVFTSCTLKSYDPYSAYLFIWTALLAVQAIPFCQAALGGEPAVRLKQDTTGSSC